MRNLDYISNCSNNIILEWNAFVFWKQIWNQKIVCFEYSLYHFNHPSLTLFRGFFVECDLRFIWLRTSLFLLFCGNFFCTCWASRSTSDLIIYSIFCIRHFLLPKLKDKILSLTFLLSSKHLLNRVSRNINEKLFQ